MCCVVWLVKICEQSWGNRIHVKVTWLQKLNFVVTDLILTSRTYCFPFKNDIAKKFIPFSFHIHSTILINCLESICNTTFKTQAHVWSVSPSPCGSWPPRAPQAYQMATLMMLSSLCVHWLSFSWFASTSWLISEELNLGRDAFPQTRFML